MHRLIVLLAVSACVTSIFAGLRSDERTQEIRKTMCTTRNASVYLDECQEYFATMCIYNENTSTCEELPESICIRGPEHGVFSSIFDCSHSCANGTGPKYCTDEPYEPSDSDNCTGLNNRAWFYNMTAQECQQHNTCNHRWQMPKGVNGFGHWYFCEENCRGFHIGNINGSEDRECTVSCTGDPPAICPENRTSEGSTRYFYNETSEKCEEYQACDWEKDLQGINYFIRKDFCELECGKTNTSSQEHSEEPVFSS
uniref:Putative secreted protein n=1 Tax=Amblyomma americanum TaxID=6943 RepID=A0A0C9RY63_AMBAM